MAKEELVSQGARLEEQMTIVKDVMTANSEIKNELEHRDEEIDRLGLKIKEWQDEAERLRQELDRKARSEFDLHTRTDTQAKQLRIQIHELREQRASLEVERNMLSQSKLDLSQEVQRLKRRGEEREEQVRRLLRQVEDKDQTIAELGPVLKESKRAAAMARSTRSRNKKERSWNY